MATQEERMLILRMIDEGKISADEGARLLSAMGVAEPQGATSQAPGQSQASGQSQGMSEGSQARTDVPWGSNRSTAEQVRHVRSIRVRVFDPETKREKVNVAVPIVFAEFVLRLVPQNVDVRLEKIRRAVESGQMGRVFVYEEREEGIRVEIDLE
ncbi:MAG: hypothetical protein AAF702_29860 [Chloroflexota bacterium]